LLDARPDGRDPCKVICESDVFHRAVQRRTSESAGGGKAGSKATGRAYVRFALANLAFSVSSSPRPNREVAKFSDANVGILATDAGAEWIGARTIRVREARN
jgi:hypothetical protein